MNHVHDPMTHRMARALGWTSLGLGLAQLTAPGALARATGLDDSATARTVLPIVGARELASAGPLLAGSRPAPWTWARVAGDAADLALLGTALRSRRGRRRGRVRTAIAVVACVTAVDVFTAGRSALRGGPRARRTTRLNAAITVNVPRPQVYRSWRALEELPRCMAHLESVRTTGDGRSHWTARAPLHRTVEWEAEISEDRTDEVIAWQSPDGGEVTAAGSVSFTDAYGGRGTEVRVDLEYSAPGGKAGAAVAKLFGEHPEQQVRDDLRRFKQYLETGEVVRSEGSPEGVSAARQLHQRPAQPMM